MDDGKEALKIARNLIRVGLVNSRNTDNGTVKVLFPDKDNTVSNDLPLLSIIGMPNIGERVVCIFLGNGLEEGFCLGSFYYQRNMPPEEDR